MQNLRKLSTHEYKEFLAPDVSQPITGDKFNTATQKLVDLHTFLCVDDITPNNDVIR